MSSSNCCFLTCIQMSQEAGQVVWYSHLFKTLPQFVVIHSDRGFGIVSKAKIDVFLEFSCFFSDSTDVGHLVSGSSVPFLKPAWTSGSSPFMYCWNLAWRMLSITLLVCEMHTCAIVWTFFGIAFLGIRMKTDLFQSCGHCWVFQSCWHIECNTFTSSSSFRIWNTSTGIPSPPLALFVVMIPKAHLTLHSRMSGSRWVISPSCFSESWRSFLYSSSVYPCHLLIIFCFC